MNKNMEWKKEVSFCTVGKCCGIAKLSSDGKWIIIEDDFGGSVRIPADKENFVRVITELFQN
ncbi:MAG: hypothetical protein WC460_06785 [Patescibacteria group bacterium]